MLEFVAVVVEMLAEGAVVLGLLENIQENNEKQIVHHYLSLMGFHKNKMEVVAVVGL